MKKLLFFLSLLIVSSGVFAQHRSEQEAMQIAQEFFAQKKVNKKSRLAVVPSQKLKSQIQKKAISAHRTKVANSSLYVVNDKANNRFVLVSADERMFKILGYSDNGLFEPQNMPDGLLEIIDGFNCQYDILVEHPELFSKTNIKKAPVKAIEPLIKTKWDQDSPFNDDCPVNSRATDGSKCASGCVATAMAQVMNYYKYPSKGIGSYSYTSKTQKHYQTMDFGNTLINWDNMIDTYGRDATEEQKTEVAKLMHACGVSVSMDYGSSSDGQSGASPYDIAYAMINYFGYNNNVVFKMKDYYTDEEWNDILMQELQNGRPMLYGGRGTGGHRFILDGCDNNGLYHFNFGWSGSGDGYYSLDAIRPTIDFLGSEIEIGNFSNEQSAVCQISPSIVGLHENVFYAYSYSISAYSDVKVGSSVKNSFLASNYSSSVSTGDVNKPEFNGEIGIALYDIDWNFVKTLYSESFRGSSSNSAYVNANITLDASQFKSGSQYYIAPYAKAKNSNNPTRIRQIYGKGWYLAKVEGESVTLEKDGRPTPPPPIPTGAIYASALNTNNQQTTNLNDEPTVWQLTLTRDADDLSKYWFDNFAPSVNTNNNRVYGFANASNSQISIPIGQSLGGDYSITTFGEENDIIVDVNVADSTMRISHAWGIMQNGQKHSLYSSTNYSFKPFSPIVVVVNKPLIVVDETNTLRISCATDGVSIHYTLDGTEPSKDSPLYSVPIQLTGNCTIKAIAFKGNNNSETAIYDETGFTVSKPHIKEDAVNSNIISISCSTDGAITYYTIDGTKPTINKGLRYSGPFQCDTTATILAFAHLDNWNDSEIDTLNHVVVPEPELSIENKAGELPNLITESQKLTVTSLTVKGQLNGTDIRFICEMTNKGKLAYLDLKDASIVEGGDADYESYSSYYTENDVIGNFMFYNCKELVSLKLPATATIIKGWAVDGCKKLMVLELPTSCQNVEDYALGNLKSLESIHLPASVVDFSGKNFSGCSRLLDITVDETNSNYSTIDGILFKHDGTLVKYPVAKSNAEYVIPSNVYIIGENAFDNSNLENVTIPESVVQIGSSAFISCVNLRKVSIPNSVESVGSMAFYECKNLQDISMSSEVTSLKSMVFCGCKSLREYTIGAKVKNIDNMAFDGCTSLQRFIVDANNEWYSSQEGILYSKDNKTLTRCPVALYSDGLRIPEGVETISSNAFNDCINISSFVLPTTLKTIGSSAFSGCEMTSISIPSSVTTIGFMAFYGCEMLESFAIPEMVSVVSSMILSGSKNLSYLYIPAGIEKVESYALNNCKSLTVIDSKIKKIEDVDVHYSTYSNAYTVFENMPDTCTWRVPSGPVDNLDKYVNKYKAQPWWVSTWRIVRDGEPENENSIDITINSEYQTFCSDKDLDFTDVNGLKAYIASGFDPSTGEVLMSHVNLVPAKTGLLLIGTKGQSYEVPFAETDFIYSNLFRGLLEDEEVTSGYVLDSDKFEFVAIDGTVTVKGGEAYLNVTPAGNAPRLAIKFTDTVSGIDSVILDDAEMSGAWYTLQGVRLDGKPGKPGIYVHQGRKVVVK